MNTRSFVQLVGSIAICEIAGVLGSLATTSAVRDGWYATLDKPPFTPPAWVFGPVWISLYLLMGIALFYIWKQDARTRDSRRALALFGIQLVLNIAWPFIFFTLQSPGWSLAELACLIVATLATMIAFSRVSRTSFWLLLPYLLWICFAAYLNYGVWALATHGTIIQGNMLTSTASNNDTPALLYYT